MGFLILIIILVNLTPVQNFLVREAAKSLSKKLDTKVSVEHVRVDFLNHLLVQGLYIEDQAGDTLLYAGEARVRITDWFIFRSEVPVLRYIGLKDAYAHLYRTSTSEDWNYQFVIDAFDTGKKDTTKKQNEFELDLEKVELDNVRFHMDDAWVGSDLDFDVGSFVLNADKVDMNGHVLDVDNIDIENTLVSIRDYKGGRPPKPKKPKTIDTTAFNPQNWAISLDKLNLENCAFKLQSNEKTPAPDEFDATHLGITDINITARDLKIKGDTLTAQLKNLSANERCGLRIEKMTADVTVSPNASICEDLYLQTNNSILRDYYAMHYTRFPDFQDYIEEVVMVAQLEEAKIDLNDIAYFAPELRERASVLYVSGNVKGTVDDFATQNLYLTDGNSTIRGNLAMRGLPDIEQTFIDFNNGAIYTSGQSILKYAPELREEKTIAINNLQYIQFQGSFTGYIDNFAANGVLNTNLGSITSDVKLNIQGGQKNAAYSGTIAANNFNIGVLFHEPELGKVSFRTGVSGTSFDPNLAQVRIDADISKFGFHGYEYTNIDAKGTLAKKKFEGEVLINDPNLALVFNGIFDYNNDLIGLNAKANLLMSDLQALNFTKDSVSATADFDLDWVGNSIDSFAGSAKLYNINLIRENHRLDVDSVYVFSTDSEDKESLKVESNLLSAQLSGDYTLSNLHKSFQYYISGYLPNYIAPPTEEAPEQNLTFNIVTREIDSLFAVLAPNVKGFSNAVIKGSLNTYSQSLTLNAGIPAASYNNIRINDVHIDANGNFNNLKVNMEVNRLLIGDSTLNISLTLNTTLGNDSLSFDINTYSKDAYGTASLNGRARARGDSLYVTILPSEFYLNQNKWVIPGGANALFSKEYLWIEDLYLRSGVQEISVASAMQNATPVLSANIKDLDVAMLAALAGLSSYQPDGRINGSLSVSNIYTKLYAEGNIKATNIVLGQDTIGNVVIAGSYDEAKKLASLNSVTGIYRGNSSLNVSGNLSLDSTSQQAIDGRISVSSAPLEWLSPILRGYVSNISGVVNGAVDIGGTADDPEANGQIQLADAGLKVDFLGTYYTIPSAKFTINNTQIGLGNIALKDVHGNTATLSGEITHDRFKDWRLGLSASSDKLQVLNLKDYENENFYGNLIVGFSNLSVRGPVDDITIRISQAVPVEKSHLYIPVTSGGVGTYSYVTFKSYGEEQANTIKKKDSKLSIFIDANLNPLAELTLVMDPTTGDAINATGYGNINLEIPVGNDVRMYGNYRIEGGSYTFTFRQLFFRRVFDINSGSSIVFGGPISQTMLDVDATYTTKASLSELLTQNELQIIPPEEISAARRQQNVNVILHMNGPLEEPNLTFNIVLPDQQSVGTYAYSKLERINKNDNELFDQVAALLLINSFIAPEGGVGSAAASGAINNVSDILSSTASSQLTNIINKLTGDDDISIDLKYKNYNYSDFSSGGINRNEVTLGVQKSLFQDRLIVEVGSAYDWGRPTSGTNTTNNLNIAQDFKVQWLVNPSGNLRLYAFRTGNYDLLQDANISRGGVGISWRKSFNTFSQLISGRKYNQRVQEMLKQIRSMDEEEADTTNASPTGGTW